MFGISKNDVKIAVLAVVLMAVAKRIPFTAKYL